MTDGVNQTYLPIDQIEGEELGTWTVTSVHARKGIGIECPSCHGRAIVSRHWLQLRFGFKTRACTYCNGMSFIPPTTSRKDQHDTD